jgi:hypothetical protein
VSTTTSATSPRLGDKRALKLDRHQPVAEQILGNAQASREVIQDFVPLAESLEWDLGQKYLRDRGNKAFISDASPVPFVINNDRTLSRNAAEAFFASLLEAEKEGGLEPHIFVLDAEMDGLDAWVSKGQMETSKKKKATKIGAQ